MRRLVAGLLTLPLLAGCGVRPTGVVYAGEPPVATASASSRSQVFFLLRGFPIPVGRAVSPWDAQQVFDELLRGPTSAERAKGLTTELTGVKQITVRDLGGRALFIETVPPMPKLLGPAYTQIYCTGLMLPERPSVKLALADAAGYPSPDCSDAAGSPGGAAPMPSPTE
ncbi:hypothetical protein GCM10023191_096890 [Actinoallomurus oryzae]|uniref:Lipoprotein n=1 Tax=Actinoallomurus oryzae TaxID=502180 RepID=A0ABP8R7F0_9ACTN